VSRRVIFQKIHVIGEGIIQFIPFVCAFYAFESPLFYSHHNHEGDVIVIPSTVGIRKSDTLGKAIFVLTHFKVLLL
jgi:hypothetical protein